PVRFFARFATSMVGTFPLPCFQCCTGGVHAPFASQAEGSADPGIIVSYQSSTRTPGRARTAFGSTGTTRRGSAFLNPECPDHCPTDPYLHCHTDGRSDLGVFWYRQFPGSGVNHRAIGGAGLA